MKKPRAVYTHVGQYWVVWVAVDGMGYSGVGFTLIDAFNDFQQELCKHGIK